MVLVIFNLLKELLDYICFCGLMQVPISCVFSSCLASVISCANLAFSASAGKTSLDMELNSVFGMEIYSYRMFLGLSYPGSMLRYFGSVLSWLRCLLHYRMLPNRRGTQRETENSMVRQPEVFLGQALYC